MNKRETEIANAELLCKLANDRARLEHALKLCLDQLVDDKGIRKLCISYCKKAEFELLNFLLEKDNARRT